MAVCRGRMRRRRRIGPGTEVDKGTACAQGGWGGWWGAPMVVEIAQWQLPLGGGGRRPKTSVCTKLSLQFRAPLMISIFSLRTSVLMGGGVLAGTRVE